VGIYRYEIAWNLLADFTGYSLSYLLREEIFERIKEHKQEEDERAGSTLHVTAEK